jgi:hypothetical protein
MGFLWGSEMCDKNSSCIGSNNLLEYALPDHKGIDILVKEAKSYG